VGRPIIVFPPGFFRGKGKKKPLIRDSTRKERKKRKSKRKKDASFFIEDVPHSSGTGRDWVGN